MQSKDLVRELKKAGWVVKRIKGSHHQLAHADFGYVITVPHPKKDLGKGLVRAIRKQARLDK